MKPTVVVGTREADGSLNEVIEGGETVLSCVREVESKRCGHIWNAFTVGYRYYSEYQKEGLSKRNQKPVDLEVSVGIYLERRVGSYTTISTQTHFEASLHWKV